MQFSCKRKTLKNLQKSISNYEAYLMLYDERSLSSLSLKQPAKQPLPLNVLDVHKDINVETIKTLPGT